MSDLACMADGTFASKWQHPPSFYCPISQQYMHDPVVLSDGHSYERRHIERWLQDHATSPVSGLPLEQKDLFTNHALRNAIEEYFQQVFSVHRRAIRRTMCVPDKGENAASSASLIRTIDALMQCSLLVNADLSIESVLRRIMEEAKTLLGAEVASVFLLDAERQELYSTVNSTGGELRIPVTFGIAGCVARSGEPLVVHNAYTDSRFDRSVDVKTGFRTRNIMCVPLKDRRGGVMGVAQLINKSGPGIPASEQAHSITEVTGVAAPGSEDSFTADDQHFFMVFASQAASAIANSGTFAMPQQMSQPHMAGVGRVSPVASLSSRAESEARLKSREEVSPKAAPPAKMDNAAGAGELLEMAYATWQLDAFALAKATVNRPLSKLGMFLFRQLGLIEDFGLSEDKLSRFLEEIERGYDNAIPYHNRTHAASVLHSMHALLEHGGLMKFAALALEDARASTGAGSTAQLGRMACLLAAAIHDYEHMGLNNDFLVKTRHERAITYNDQHVNEHHHVAAAFRVLRRPHCNFLEHLPASDFRQLRSLVIDLVLGTDMAEHGKILQSACEALKEASGGSGADRAPVAFEPASRGEAVLLLQLAIKAADLGHLTLDWDWHFSWVQRLEQEFFRQGDMEKEAGLPVSFLMDRTKLGVSATQVGFCEHVAMPLFRRLVALAPGAEPMLATFIANYQRWKELEAGGPPLESDRVTRTPKRRTAHRFAEPPAAADVPATAARASSTASSGSCTSEDESEGSGGLRGERGGRVGRRAARWLASAVRCSTRSRSPGPLDS